MRLRTYNEEDAIRAGHDGSVDKSNMTCPFCATPDFDDVGLKAHLTRGHCDAFEKVLTLDEWTKQYEHERQRSKEETEKTRKELAEMPRDKFLHLSRELSELLGR